MAVDKGILVREVGSTLAVNEYGTVGVILLTEDMIQIVEVIIFRLIFRKKPYFS